MFRTIPLRLRIAVPRASDRVLAPAPTCGRGLRTSRLLAQGRVCIRNYSCPRAGQLVHGHYPRRAALVCRTRPSGALWGSPDDRPAPPSTRRRRAVPGVRVRSPGDATPLPGVQLAGGRSFVTRKKGQANQGQRQARCAQGRTTFARLADEAIPEEEVRLPEVRGANADYSILSRMAPRHARTLRRRSSIPDHAGCALLGGLELPS